MAMPGIKRIMLATVAALLLFCLCSGGLVLAQDQPQDQDQGQSQASGAPRVFFYQGDELVGVARPMGEQFMEELVLELCGGPTEEEKAQGLTSAIPDGVNLMYSTKSMTGSTYTVTLSDAFLQLKDDPAKAARAMEQFRRTLGQVTDPDNISIKIYISAEQREEDATTALGLVSAQPAASEKKTFGTTTLIILILIALALVLFATGAELWWKKSKVAKEAAAEEHD